MHAVNLIILICVFFCIVSDIVASVGLGYHERVGIPKAKWLMQTEGLARIVGGTQATQSAIPHQAGIAVTLTTGWTSICGGTLVSNTRVLTAAHCWWDGNNQAQLFTIVLGSLTIFSGGTRIATNDIVTHPSWNPAAITHDIALVRLSGGVSFDNNIQAIPLPTMTDVQEDFSGMSAVASGYGKTSDAQNSFPITTSLYHTTLTIITNTECQRSFDITLHGSHLCTSGLNRVGTCDGDSGGPLTLVWNNRRILVGVVSFGLADGCQLGFPSVFTRVTAFIGWIEAYL